MRKICVLSVEEAARLEHYDIWPACKAHRHISASDADILVNEDTMRWIGGADTKLRGPVTMITSTYLDGRTWRNRASGGPQGMKVQQFVPA